MLYTNWNSSKAWQTLLQSVERELGSMEQPGECNQAEDTWMWDSLSSKNEIKKLYIHLLVYVWSKPCFLLCYEALSWIHDWKAWRERPELTHTLCSITTYLLKIIKFLLQNLHLLQISTHFLTGERCFLLIDPLLELVGFTEKHELLAAFFQHAFTFFSQFQERVIPGRSRKGKQGTVRWTESNHRNLPSTGVPKNGESLNLCLLGYRMSYLCSWEWRLSRSLLHMDCTPKWELSHATPHWVNANPNLKSLWARLLNHSITAGQE